MSTDGGALRIGEFARRVGVSAELLRAWERRYGLLRPVRSSGGFRLYTDADADRVARMRQALDTGLSAAEAAQLALSTERPTERLIDGAVDRLLDAIARYDEAGVHQVLDESLAAFGLEPILRDVIMPTLHTVGERWGSGELGVSHEHFASNVIRGRLMSLARLWGRGRGPVALLACVPGEEHDISLLAFGLVLRSHGWRIIFLGANTPMATIVRAAGETAPELVVMASFRRELIEAEAARLRALSSDVKLLLGGPGTESGVGELLGLDVLRGDPVSAATEVAVAGG